MDSSKHIQREYTSKELVVVIASSRWNKEDISCSVGFETMELGENRDKEFRASGEIAETRQIQISS